jgi:dienelactone hydrolase
LIDTSTDQSRLSKAARVTDSLMALKSLRAHPRILSNNIIRTGYSFGAIVAMHVTEHKNLEAIIGKNVEFAASLPVYPYCQAGWQNPMPTNAPMLIFVEEKTVILRPVTVWNG